MTNQFLIEVEAVIIFN